MSDSTSDVRDQGGHRARRERRLRHTLLQGADHPLHVRACSRARCPNAVWGGARLPSISPFRSLARRASAKGAGCRFMGVAPLRVLPAPTRCREVSALAWPSRDAPRRTRARGRERFDHSREYKRRSRPPTQTHTRARARAHTHTHRWRRSWQSPE